MTADMEMFYGLCCFGFLFTFVLVLMWLGVEMPQIIRNSDEAEVVAPIPEKRMVQVDNPFVLELGSGPASVAGGVTLRPSCLAPCVLTCFWGCEVAALQEALQTHQRAAGLRSSRLFQEVLRLRFLCCQTFHVAGGERPELHTRIPPGRGVSDFGPLPRERYPLVAVLTLGEPEARNASTIVANVTVVHVPDDKHRISARILFQFLLTARGNVNKLMSIFMAADGSDEASEPGGPRHREDDDDEEEEEEDGGGAGDCVVCRGAPVNRVLLPCRHACVCDGCVLRFQHCPVCRAVVLESFALAPPT